MAVIKCRECGGQVSTKADKCPGCGAPPPPKHIPTIPGLLIIGLATWVIFKMLGADFGSDSAPPEPPKAATCGSEGMAYVMSQNFVKKHLRAPSSAKFPYRPTAQSYAGDCRHSIVGTFESQNSFGAMLRGSYSVTMIYLPDEKKWRAENLVIN